MVDIDPVSLLALKLKTLFITKKPHNAYLQLSANSWLKGMIEKKRAMVGVALPGNFAFAVKICSPTVVTGGQEGSYADQPRYPNITPYRLQARPEHFCNFRLRIPVDHV